MQKKIGLCFFLHLMPDLGTQIEFCQIKLELTGKIWLNLNPNSSLFVEYGRKTGYVFQNWHRDSCKN